MATDAPRQPSLLGLPEKRRPARVKAVVSIPVKQGVKPMSYRPTAELHTKLMLHAMESGISMQKVIDAALGDYFAKLEGV